MLNFFKIIRHTSTVSALLTFCFLLSVSAWAQDGGSWRKFVAESEGYTVSLPAAPVKLDVPLPSDANTKLATYVSSLGDLKFMVITGLVPTIDWTAKSHRDNFLAGMNSSACAPNRQAGNTCTVVMVRDLEYKKLPARDFKVVVNDENVSIGRIVFAGTKVYTLMASGYGVEKSASDVEKFISSFELSAK